MRNFTVVNRERVYSGFQSIDELTIHFEDPDGSHSHELKRLVVERGNAVGVLVHDTGADTILLAKQFRAAMIEHGEPWLAEIAAGMIDEGENPEEAARREVEEELGYRLRELVNLGEMYATPGGSSEMLTLFYASVSETDRVNDGGGTDEHEDIEIIRIPRQQAIDMVNHGQLRDAKTQIAILKSVALRLLKIQS